MLLNIPITLQTATCHPGLRTCSPVQHLQQKFRFIPQSGLKPGLPHFDLSISPARCKAGATSALWLSFISKPAVFFITAAPTWGRTILWYQHPVPRTGSQSKAVLHPLAWPCISRHLVFWPCPLASCRTELSHSLCDFTSHSGRVAV